MRHILLTIACGIQLVAAHDLQAKSEHIVHLSSGKHHDSLAKEWPNALHAITHLPSVPALILDLTAAEVAALKRDDRVRWRLGVLFSKCPDDDEYVCRGGGSANYAPTPRPVSAPKSPGNYAPTYQPTESEDRRLAGAPTLRGSYSV